MPYWMNPFATLAELRAITARSPACCSVWSGVPMSDTAW